MGSKKLISIKEEQRPYVFDDALSRVGEWGCYQRRVFLLLCLPVVSCALHKLAWVVIGTETEHRCLLPFERAENTSFALPDALLNESVPWSVTRGGWSRCERWENSLSEELVPSSFTVSCEDWVFEDSTTHPISAVTEFRLVCSRGWTRAAANSVLMVGELLGASVFGHLADRLGRRPVLLSALLLQLAAGLAASVVPSYSTLLGARLLLGASVPGVYLVGFVLGTELVGRTRRSAAGVAMQVFFSAGYLLTAGLAALVQQLGGGWRHLQLVLTAPGLLYVIYWWLIPESPRWLLSRGRVKEAATILQRAAISNKRQISVGEMDKMLMVIAETLHREQEQQNDSILSLLRYPALLRSATILLFTWLVLSLVYYVVAWSPGALDGRAHLALSGLAEVPGYAMAMLTLSRLGSRPVLGSALLAAALALVAIAILPPDAAWAPAALANALGKTAVTAAYGAAYVLSAQSFPTSVRSAGLGLCSAAAGVGGALAPTLVLLSDGWRCPLLLLAGGVLLTGLAVVTLLPETPRCSDLPDTCQEGEQACR